MQVPRDGLDRLVHICIARRERKSGAASPGPPWFVFSPCLRSGPSRASDPVPGDPLHITDYWSRPELREPPQAYWSECRAFVAAQGVRLPLSPG
ncbi:hypothetical protein SMG44B_20436 [Stenotrophomonas maltophilia]